MGASLPLLTPAMGPSAPLLLQRSATFAPAPPCSGNPRQTTLETATSASSTESGARQTHRSGAGCVAAFAATGAVGCWLRENRHRNACRRVPPAMTQACGSETLPAMRRRRRGSSDAHGNVLLGALSIPNGCGCAARWQRPIRLSVAVCSGGDDPAFDNLPTDEEFASDLQAALPPGERVRRKMAIRAEDTLRQANERIAELGVDLEADEREQRQRSRLFPALEDDRPLVVALGPWPDRYVEPSAEDEVEPGEVEELFQQAEAVVVEGEYADSAEPLEKALRSWLPSSSTLWLNLDAFAEYSPEDIEKRLKGRVAAAICPGTDVKVAARGLAALLEHAPDCLIRVVLLAETGGAAEDSVSENGSTGVGLEGLGNPFGLVDASLFGSPKKQPAPTRPLEDTLTIAARERSKERLSKPPLYVTVVRATVGEVAELSLPPQVIAKLPATVGDAARGLRTTLVGGVQSAAALAAAGGSIEEAARSEIASVDAVGAALAFAVRRGVDVRELAVLGCCRGVDDETALWEELMLPLVGPELWRLPVEDPRRARAWVRGWVEFNYCRGANQAGSAAMRKAGLRTPVEVREVPNGMCIKFLAGDRRPGAGFDGLDQGGLEILVDDARGDDRPGRIRVRRCAYGWGIKPRESSERAILSRLRKDWDMVQKFQEPAD